jgi:hypothetical protein
MDSTIKSILDIIVGSGLATGIDVSRYNGAADFDQAEFTKTLEIIDYCMVRASSGVSDGTIYIDPALDTFYAELEEHPHIVRDFYHYLSSHSSWTAQYDKFMKAIDGLAFEWLTLDGEKIFNEKSSAFALSAYRFMQQLQKDFPDKRIKFYSNRYDYSDWFDYYYDFDQFMYHHAQYPWSKWEVSSYYVPQLLQHLKDIFGGVRTPSLPPSRKDYEMWQIGANTGIGKELGFVADYLDVNVSRRPLDEFRTFSHLERRWVSDGSVISIPSVPMTNEELTEKVIALWNKVFPNV